MAIVLDTPVAVRRAAMDLLARREHGRAELSRKLRQRGASAELIDPALDRLAEEGLLDESAISKASSPVAPVAAMGRCASVRNWRNAVCRGADIERALGACEVDWSAQLREVWRRKFARLPQDAREKAQQGRFLAYRSYSVESISRLLNGRSDD